MRVFLPSLRNLIGHFSSGSLWVSKLALDVAR